ncbi:MAG: UDP-N-acetylglucosamine 1-carboxyvinyltransferase [Defluviitaleaceae bacterium]|nr:UDP-N-acetylglucosamine 1-carboxyvinyltransferase [Defluviitaleaceae bacterium]
MGQRPIDQHLKGLEMLGASVEDDGESLRFTAEKLVGADIELDFPSVGATQNIMLAAVAAEGTTRIINAAREPEIEDLAKYLNAMGADVHGAGGRTIVIYGTRDLHGAKHRVMPDRIVAGTYLAAAAMTRGDLTLTNVSYDEIRPVAAKLADAGCRIYSENDMIRLKAPQTLRAISVKTMPHPGFPTDLQPQFTAMLAMADGLSVIEETVFDARNNHIPELGRMGADILQVNNRIAIIQGVPTLRANTVTSHDLRGGAALILAGLTAEGTTIVAPSEHVRRGYESIETDLGLLGADIRHDEHF